MNLLNQNSQIDKNLVIPGLIPGIVSNNKDPDGLGRIKVLLPLIGVDPEEKDKKKPFVESDWAPVMASSAGPKYGEYFIPEIDNEVMVAFILGDINRPIIVGGLWNNKDLPPEKNTDGKNDIKQISTRSGSTILFNDKEGDAQIQIYDKDKKDEITISAKKNSIDIVSEKLINLASANGKITIKAKDIEIKADNSLKLESKQVNIKSTAAMKIDGGTINVKSNGSVTVKGTIINLN